MVKLIRRSAEQCGHPILDADCHGLTVVAMWCNEGMMALFVVSTIHYLVPLIATGQTGIIRCNNKCELFQSSDTVLTLSVSSAVKSVNAWPWEPGVDFRESLNIVQGSSPRYSFTFIMNARKYGD